MDQPAPEAALVLAPTPLEELTTDGMDPEMIWEQMEMRAGVVVELLEEMFGGGDEDDEGQDPEGSDGSDGSEGEMDGIDGEDDDESDSDGDDDDDDDDASEGSFHEEEPYFSELGPAGATLSDPVEPDADDEPVDPLADENAGLTLDTFDSPGSGRQRRYARLRRSARGLTELTFLMS